MNPSIPVFVKIEEYKEILDIIDVIRNKIDKAKGTLSKISELKDQEDTGENYQDKNQFSPAGDFFKRLFLLVHCESINSIRLPENKTCKDKPCRKAEL